MTTIAPKRACHLIVIVAVIAATADCATAQVYGTNRVAQQHAMSQQQTIPQHAMPQQTVRQNASVRPTMPRIARIQHVSRIQNGPPVSACGCKQINGVQCTEPGCCEKTWRQSGPIPFQHYAQGEYVGPARTAHVPVYRLRPDDQIDCVFRITRNRMLTPYELNVGDEIEVKSFADERLEDKLIIQPDGSITLSLLGQVTAAGMSVDELRKELDNRYKKYYNNPSITVTPLRVNTKLEDLRATVDGRQGFGGQSLQVRVTPDGTIALPAVESIAAQGLSLAELKEEIDARYRSVVEGIEVTPVLTLRAPRYLYVVGEVANPGRFTLEAPTTLIQAIALAGSWNVGANIEQVVVFRRDENWCLTATMQDVRQALLGNRPCPAGEIWIRDGDIVIVPKSKILLSSNFIDLVFTRNIYGLLPGQGSQIYFSRFGRL